MSAGVFIDIDGVVLHGGKPFEWSKQAIHTLWSNEIPFVFVTNGTYASANLVKTLTDILELPFTDDHIIVAPSPCTELHEYHDKRVLVCCQDSSIDLIPELGFTNYMTIPELSKIFPELDFVDHNKRKELLKNTLTEERQRWIDEFRPIEAIVLLGEPINWECALQLIIDSLMTSGDPRKQFKFVPYPHLPLIVCNKDLTFKGAAALPRFGHGAFLECLENLYYKITKNELEYDQIMGKPFLVTYDYAVHKIQKQAKPGRSIDKFFIIGDNPEVDIKGANLYKEHLLKIASPPSKKLVKKISRRSSSITNLEQTDKIESILVCTGVYNPQSDIKFHLNNLFISSQNEEKNKVEKFDDNNNVTGMQSLNVPSSNSFYIDSTHSSTQASRKNSSVNTDDMDKLQLKNALSRKNSFIGYFEDRYNQPDMTVDNLMDAVNYIIKEKILS